MSEHVGNGEWPELPRVPPEIKPLPEHPSPGQVIKALGDTLLMFGQLWPRNVQALEYLKAHQEKHDALHQEAALAAGQSLPPSRDPEGSWHDWDQDLEKARIILRDRVKNPDDKLDTKAARRIALEVFETIKTKKELATWRSMKSWPRKLLWECTKAVVALAAGGAVIEIWHWLHH